MGSGQSHSVFSFEPRRQLAGMAHSRGWGEATRVTELSSRCWVLEGIASRRHAGAFAWRCFPECTTLRCTKDKLDAHAKDKATGRIFDKLFIRHWDTWSNGTRSHLFIARIDADGTATGRPLDLSKSLDADVPSKPFGDDADYSFSPDGGSIVFSARIAGRTEPWSTNFDLFQVPVELRRAEQPDGQQSCLGRAAGVPEQRRSRLAGDGSARLRVGPLSHHVERRHTGAVRATDAVVGSLGSQPGRHARRSYAVGDGGGCGPDGAFCDRRRHRHAAQARGHGQVAAYRRGQGPGRVITLENLGGADRSVVTPIGGGALATADPGQRNCSARRRLGEFEQFSFKGWNDETVYGYVVKPYGFEPGKRFPVALWFTAARKADSGTSGTIVGMPKHSPAAATRSS